MSGGGHKMAAGLTMSSDKIGKFRSFFEERLEAQVEAARTKGGLRIDGALSLKGASRDLAETILAAGPFGAGHSEPVFALADISIIKADIVGEAHIRVILGGSDGSRMKAIAFRVVETPLGNALLGSDGRTLHLAGKLKLDNWRGARDVQFQIEDGVWA